MKFNQINHMSNNLPKGKVFDMDAINKQKQQYELQKQSFVANTRLRLAEMYLNTLIGRLDADLTADGQMEVLVDMSIDYANALMNKLGIVLPVE
jgi:ribosome assembly protein YihI (activator of Der GTPase)